jgi:hypothetical protein
MSRGSQRDQPPGTPPTPESQHESTHAVIRDEPYYSRSPEQGRAPDGAFAADTFVAVLRVSAGGNTKVRTEDGREGFVKTGALQAIGSGPRRR